MTAATVGKDEARCSELRTGTPSRRTFITNGVRAAAYSLRRMNARETTTL